MLALVEGALRWEGAALGDVDPSHVLAAGGSQSAFALVTYVNGVQPLAEAFDGFLVHSRGGSGLPVSAGGEPADIDSALAGPPAILRTELDVTVPELQSETEVTGIFSYALVREDDTDTFRLGEVAGNTHAEIGRE